MVACLRRGVVVVALAGLGNGVQAEYGEWMGDEAPPSSDLITHHVRNAVLDGANVTAAQGSFEGPAVLQALFSTSSWAALTGIHLAVGVITLGANGDDGCGVIPFHNHPNCFEVMTTVSGYGAYGQIRPDGTTQWSRVLHPGDTWVMQQGSQHYYRNLDPNGTWQFEIAFTCSEVGAESMWKWIGYIDEDLARTFYPGLSETAAVELTIRPDQNLRKDSPRYIQNCSADMAKHSAIVSDNDLYDATFDFDADLQTPGRISFTNAPFGSHNTWRNQRAALTLGYVQMRPLTMMRPTVCATANIVYHVLEGEAVVAQWTWDNKMAVDVIQAHDLVLVPIGSVHFIINPLSGPGSPELRMLAHYDSELNPPSLSVASNFFSAQDATLLEAVLKTSLNSATNLASIASQPMFDDFTGSLEALKSWVRSQEDYRPLSGSDDSHGSGSDDSQGSGETEGDGSATGSSSSNENTSEGDGSATGSSGSTENVPGWLIALVFLGLLINIILAWVVCGIRSALGQRNVDIAVANKEYQPQPAETRHHFQHSPTEAAPIAAVERTPSNAEASTGANVGAVFEPNTVVYYDNNETWAYFKQLPGLFKSGTVQSDTMVWVDADRFGSDWKELGQFVQLWNLQGATYHHHQASTKHLPPPPLPPVPTVAEGDP